MPVTPQSLDKVSFTRLKGLHNVEISFVDKPVTAIFGVNGCGKTTVLHALACLYRPASSIGEKNYFTRFFKRENGVLWTGSKLRAYFTIKNHSSFREYGKAGDRWTPRIESRPQRDVVYLGISSCVPDIELVAVTVTNFAMGAVEDVQQKETIVRAASTIMNYDYSNYAKASFLRKKYKKVVRDSATINYSSLAMGAGEQRLFNILEILYSLPAYSLFLIDELDLTLHTSALMKLVDELTRVAQHKHLQIVFTTHREELALRKDINIRHIWKTANGNDTFVLDHTSPDCLLRLTGKMEKQLEVYVEDDLAEYIARQVARDKGLLPYTSFLRFGAIENAFVVAAGCDIQEADSDNKIFLLDGDKYRTDAERMTQMQKCYSGNEAERDARRLRAISHIRQFTLLDGEQPEHYLWMQLKSTNNDLAMAAQEVIAVAEDKHAYLYDVQMRCGESRDAFLTRLTSMLSQEPFWNGYVAELASWLDDRKRELGL